MWLSSFSFPGKSKVEEMYDTMFTVTSQLTFTVTKEDDGVPVVCIVDHPAVKDVQAQTYLVVHCEYGPTLKPCLFLQKYSLHILYENVWRAWVRYMFSTD